MCVCVGLYALCVYVCVCGCVCEHVNHMFALLCALTAFQVCAGGGMYVCA